MTRPNQKDIQTLFGLLAVATSAACLAGEGRLEINQTCAVNDGCFAGDDPGLPVEIAEAGSYVLTSDLDLPADTHGIDLRSGSDGSTIDLNGFAIRGPESCSGTPVTDCTGDSHVAGIFGIDVDAQVFVSGVTVKDGRVTGMSGSGIQLGPRSRVMRVHVLENATGVSLDEDSTLEKITAARNLGSGIFTQSGSMVVESRVVGNGGVAGMRVFDDSVVVESTARNNADQGFQVSNGGILQSSVTVENGGDGVVITEGKVVDVNTARNGGRGITCASSPSAVQGTVVQDNAGDALSTRCVEIGANLCDGDTNC